MLKNQVSSTLLFFRWDTQLYMSLFPSVRPFGLSIPSSLCHTAYLRNRASPDHNFWYTYVKWWYLHAFFFIFSKFCFFGLLGGKRAKNSPKWEITIASVMHHTSAALTSSDHNFWYTYVKWQYLQVFFSFFFFF